MRLINRASRPPKAPAAVAAEKKRAIRKLICTGQLELSLDCNDEPIYLITSVPLREEKADSRE
jgi:hypothetical protein